MTASDPLRPGHDQTADSGQGDAKAGHTQRENRVCGWVAPGTRKFKGANQTGRQAEEEKEITPQKNPRHARFRFHWLLPMFGWTNKNPCPNIAFFPMFAGFLRKPQVPNRQNRYYPYP